MFDILFGWRKASKCKKVIKMVKCRLKFLKNKRCCIVKQLREDVAELLKHGHHQTAFERVEQIIMDESMVQLYDLLDQFCEFIIFHLPYIRKSRDCPNDINEAASTLIFSSARFGELPELMSIRKLFGERYGQRFVIIALELRPGNLVNHQIKDNLYIKKVSDDLKYRLLAEIASSCMQQGPLFLEYKPENQIIHMDLSSETTRTSNEACFGLGDEQILPNAVQYLDTGGQKLMNPANCNEMDKLTICRHESHTMESSSESSSAKLSEEMIYLDDIEEFVSPVTKDGNLQDQRLFIFKSFGTIPLNEKADYEMDLNLEDHQNLSEEKLASRSSRKMSKKRRSISQENRIVTDIECATYYDESETSPDNYKCKSHYQREPTNKILVQERRKSYGAKRTQDQTCFSLISHRDDNNDIAKNCSFEHACYFYSKAVNEALESRRWITKTNKDFSLPSLKEGKIQYGLEYCKPEDDREGKQIKQCSCLRAMTMSAERPKESLTDNNIIRSISFPYEQPRSGYSSCRHIHPKIPDYDELAAKFKALKRANLDNDQKSSNLRIYRTGHTKLDRYVC